MTTNQKFVSDVKSWANATRNQIRAVAVDSIFDVLEAAQTSAPGITAGGTLIEGKIPVVSSDLINSLSSGLKGGGGQMGPGSYAVVLASFDLGDFLEFSWTMVYARRIEYGFSGTDKLGRRYQQEGWNFVGANAARWSQIVEQNKARLMN